MGRFFNRSDVIRVTQPAVTKKSVIPINGLILSLEKNESNFMLCEIVQLHLQMLMATLYSKILMSNFLVIPCTKNC